MSGAVWTPIHDLAFWEENPNEGDVGAIYAAIKQFGYNDVLAVWHGIIKGGNHRVKALQIIQREPGENGDFFPRSKALRIVDGEWQIQVLDVSHLETEAEADAFALALNRTARLGRDDPKQLLKILDQAKGDKEELVEAAGYDEDTMQRLQQLTEGAFTPLVDPQSTTRQVTSEEVAQMYDDLLVQYQRNPDMEIEVFCPDCFSSFFLKVKELISLKGTPVDEPNPL